MIYDLRFTILKHEIWERGRLARMFLDSQLAGGPPALLS